MSRHQQKHSRLVRVLRVMLHRRRYSLTVSALSLMAMVFGVLYYDWDVEPIKIPEPRSWTEIVNSDTLRVVTIPSSYTAFQFKGEWHGHEYDNAVLVAKALGLELSVVVATSEKAMADSLFAGAADVAISPMEFSLVEGHWFLRPAGLRWADSQCIASARKLDISAYTDSLMTDSIMGDSLPHYRLSIIEGSAQWKIFVNDSVRASYDFRPYLLDTIPADSLSIEHLTDSMVIVGNPEAVMMRCNVARLMHDYYPTLVISDTIPMSQDTLAWMVAAGADTLREKIDSVAKILLDPGTPLYTVSMHRIQNLRGRRARRASQYAKRDGAISPYDDIFRRKGEEYGLDWRLLAGIAYIESNFRHDIVSRKGPVGLMQLMPQTIRNYGYTEEEALDPENNVDMAAKLMSNLSQLVRGRVPGISEDNVVYFALVGYNAGLGHLYDAIRLAETLGYNPCVWTNNVEHCLRLKSDPQYYKMSVVKSGKFNGAFTINYVNEVTAAYQTFCAQDKLENKKK